MIGAGTVLSPAEADAVAEAGGKFVVSPDTNSEVITATRRHGMASYPGVFSPTESAAVACVYAVFVVRFVYRDLGWRDVGYHESEIRTPNLDRLAREGVRLERHYVYPTCSPTRAGLLTGRNPSRFGIQSPIAGRSTDTLPDETMTLSRALKGRGYVSALAGKWHLGLRPEAGPRRSPARARTAS